MPLDFDTQTWWMLGGVTLLLLVFSLIGEVLSRRARSEAARNTVENLKARTRAWWVMVIVFVAAMAMGRIGTVVLFGLLSFLGLREFITMTPTRPGDHRSLFWVFFIVLPLQYWLVGTGWYGFFAVLIPVYAFLIIPLRAAMAGECEGFLERQAKIQWAMMICVYCLSHAPALLMLEIEGYAGQQGKLLFYLVLVAQLSDVFQYVFGKTMGRHKLAPRVSPNKTWEGLLGGMLAASLCGALLHPVTPFGFWAAAGLSLVITFMGFAGGLVLSAIKRDRGIKDYGSMIEGHGGVMDRMDSICFAAPVFFHLVRYGYVG